MLERRDVSSSAFAANSQGIPEALKPLFNSMPEYVPGTAQSLTNSGASVASIINEQEKKAETLAENNVREKAENNAQISSIANSLHNSTIIAENTMGADDIIKLVHTEIEPSEFGINSFAENNMVSHLEPSANSLSATTNVENNAENLSPVDDSTPSDAKEDEDLYSIKNFSI
jgi:hypothetical protein